MKPLNVTPNI
jgi:hypothetical protein